MGKEEVEFICWQFFKEKVNVNQRRHDVSIKQSNLDSGSSIVSICHNN